MKNYVPVVICLVIFFLFSQASLAQIEEDTTRYRIETTDGNEYIGIITYQDQEITRLQTENIGEITLYNRNIITGTL